MSDERITIAVESLAKQGVEQVENGHDAFTVVCALAVEQLDHLDDNRTDWHHQYGIGPHVRSHILRELHDWKYSELHDFLEEANHAETIGYDPEKTKDDADAPSYSAIRRAWTEYFGPDLKQLVEEVAQHIREHARETGNLIGSLPLEAEDKESASERTQYRVKRRLAHQMIEQFRTLFYDEIEINIPENASFEKEDLLDFFLHIALTNDFANNGAKTWKEEVDDESTAPSGDTLRDYIRMFDELEYREVSQMFNEVSELLWKLADHHGFLDGFVDTAIDEHAWRYYGDSDTARITTVKPDRGTKYAYEFLTLSVIGDRGERFTVAIRHVASKQEKLQSIKDLMEEADERLFVRVAVMDRGFSEVLFAQAMKETGVKFLARGRKNSKTKSMWENAENGVNVEHDVEMSRSRPPYESVRVTRIVVKAKESAKDEYMAFIMNWRVTKRQAKRLAGSYERRWGIETSYRVTDDFLPKTTSTDFALRQYYYRMAVLLYNVWVLVNGVVAKSLGLSADAAPPVTAKYLLTVLQNKHREDGVT